jgi:H+-translocating NAD(P) transhydrogenase subunit alpha
MIRPKPYYSAMHVFAGKETAPGETRVALTPESAARLVRLGLTVTAEAGLGHESEYSDAEYEKAGAKLVPSGPEAGAGADIRLRVRKPSLEQISALKPGSMHLSFLDPFNEPALIQEFARARVSAASLEMIPRTTLAQKMDALSSQANLAGYVAVIAAAERLRRILPMMMTPAGTISPARVFVIGVGVAGLQAIATAKRLGARVEAFDTRPVVKEQVQSLGAKFVEIDVGGETGQTAQGYAKALTAEQLAKQRAGMAKVCSTADVVITTAKLFGRKSPTLVTREMIAGMKAGSVIVDLAVESGGNVEGSRMGEEVVTENGVRVIGHAPLEARVAHHASQVLAANFASFLEHFWDAEAKALRMDRSDEILKGCLITHNGEIVHEQFRPKAETASS